MGEIQIPYCPQGYIASGNGYTSRYDGIVAHIQDKTKCIDDTLLWSQTVEEVYRQATEWLDTCGNNGVTLNPAKFRFARDEVEFAGFDITPTTVKPCQKYVRAISDFPTPKNLTDVRSWFGLVNQVSYAFSMTVAMAPFHELLKPTQKFEWTASHDAAFRESKRVIAQEIQHGVEIFDKNNASPQTGPRTGWATGSFKSIAAAHPKTSSVAQLDGGSHWWDRGLHTQPNHDMPPSRERHWQWLTP